MVYLLRDSIRRWVFFSLFSSLLLIWAGIVRPILGTEHLQFAFLQLSFCINLGKSPSLMEWLSLRIRSSSLKPHSHGCSIYGISELFFSSLFALIYLISIYNSSKFFTFHQFNYFHHSRINSSSLRPHSLACSIFEISELFFSFPFIICFILSYSLFALY